MKSVQLLLFLLSFQSALSQTIIKLEGTVTDSLTKEPLAYANIYVPGTNYGTVTNLSGRFILKFPATLGDVTIRFSYLGYKRFEVSLREAGDTSLAISLEHEALELEEIVVKPPDPLDIVFNSVEKISQNYDFDFYRVNGFQREHVNHAGKTIQLLEAAFETTYLGLEEGQYSNVLNACYVEDKEAKSPLWSPSRGGFYTFGWTTVSGIQNPDKSHFLGINVKKKSDLAKYYEFSLRESISSDDKELYVIDFDQKKVKRPLLKGTIYIDPSSGAIVKIMYELSPRGRRYLRPHETWGGTTVSKLPKRIDVQKDRCEITYRKYGTKWYLHTMVTDAEFDASLVFFRIAHTQKLALQFHSERIVTAIDTTTIPHSEITSNIEDVGSLPTLQNFIKKNFETYEQREQELWSDINIIRADSSFASIAKRLQANNRTWVSDAGRVPPKARFTPQQLFDDLQFLKESLEGIHPGLYWHTNKETIDSEFNSLKQKIENGGTERDFFELLSPLIEKIHCGHTNIRPSLHGPRPTERFKQRFPLDVWINGDSAIVTKSLNGISKGSQILSINEHPMREIIQRILSETPADGHNVTFKEFRIRTEFGYLFPLYFNSLDTFDVRILDVDGSVRDVRLPGSDETDMQRRTDHFAFTVLDSLQTALLTISSFTGVDFPLFIKNTFDQIERQDVRNLIIDIRNNNGGQDHYGLLLYAYLASKPFMYYEKVSVQTMDTALLGRLAFGDVSFNSAIPDYVSHIKEEVDTYRYESHANLGWHNPKEKAFTGSVYILVNGGTFSTAAEFASIAHANHRAFFIGEETGGGYQGNCSLGTPTLTLPNSGLRVSVPLARYELAVPKTVMAGSGLIPDLQTQYFSTDVLENRDKDLAHCLDLIARRKN